MRDLVGHALKQGLVRDSGPVKNLVLRQGDL